MQKKGVTQSLVIAGKINFIENKDTWEKHRQQKIWASAGKCHHKWTFVLNLFSTELPFTRGSFAASVRDHNLREASHLYYEGKE
jgi:hypothetical protein